MSKVWLQMVTCISTFAGTGGSSLGYHMAGYKELLAIDFDKHATDCFHLNFPKVPVWTTSIVEVSAKDILKFCNLSQGDLDVFDGSPPCQGFSMAGKRQVSDPRNDLFIHYCRLVKELKPKVFIMENVTGMYKGKMRGRFLEIYESLGKLDYNIKCKVMNAKHYGVPQSRERVIFIGVRNDLKKIPVFPTPSPQITTAGLALKDIKPSEKIWLSDKYGKLWPKLKPGQNAAHLLGKGQNSCVKLDPNKPSCTLPKTQTGKGFATICHWAEPRAIAINEALVLSSFPENWHLIGTYSEKWSRIGNAVMPKFMKAVAGAVKTNILKQEVSYA